MRASPPGNYASTPPNSTPTSSPSRGASGCAALGVPAPSSCGIAQRLGLIRAVRYALRLGVGEIEAAVKARAARLCVGLAGPAGVVVHDLGVDRCGIVTFTVEGTDSARVRDVLAGQGATVNVSRRPSTLLDMTRRGLSSIVRASPHYFIDDAQIDRCIGAVGDVGRPARPPTGRWQRAWWPTVEAAGLAGEGVGRAGA